MDRELLLGVGIPENKVDKILEIKSDNVTFEMLSKGQKKVFVAIVTLIERNMNPPKNKPDTPITDASAFFGNEKKHVTLNGPAGT